LRIAALAFGVLAGLVAALILALGGLDPGALAHADPRQVTAIRFGLFVVEAFGIFGAGLVIAVPLAGTILMVVGAIGWVVAAVLLHHGPDFVMLTPPALLLAAAGLAATAVIRGRARNDDADDYDRDALDAQRAAISAGARPPADNEEEDEEEDGAAVPVGASFFGEAGTATPLRGAMQPEPGLRGLERDRDDRNDNWEPVRRRIEPPRTKSMFVSPEDEYDDEEGGFARGARIVSSILSFGLYAALAGAAVLIFLNLRVGEANHPSATKIEAPASVPKAPALTSSAPTVHVAEAPAAPSTPLGLTQPGAASFTPPTANAADLGPPIAPAPSVSPPGQQLPSTQRGLVAETTQPSSLPPAQPAASSAPPPAAEPAGDLTGQGLTGPVMPFPMTVAMAAERAPAKPVTPAAPAATPKPATPKPKPAAPRQPVDTGM